MSTVDSRVRILTFQLWEIDVFVFCFLVFLEICHCDFVCLPLHLTFSIVRLGPPSAWHVEESSLGLLQGKYKVVLLASDSPNGLFKSTVDNKLKNSDFARQ